MKNIHILFVLALFLASPNLGHAVIDIEQYDNPTSFISDISAEDFLNLSPKDIKAKTGKRVKLADRVALRTAQWQAKRALKKGESFDHAASYEAMNGQFSIGGFLLGFFLGLIGILLALLFGRNAVRSALLGALCWVIIVLIVVFI